jgi:hypothetical protein
MLECLVSALMVDGQIKESDNICKDSAFLMTLIFFNFRMAFVSRHHTIIGVHHQVVLSLYGLPFSLSLHGRA